ncbi:MAG TPA: class I SAM-dependent methyltransferase [Rugosimonospora sp.]|nr:class I SAM-dependent methyltransferase [Rugosimonospora sp.]
MRVRVDYDQRQYAVYAKARALTPEATSQWMEVFARYAGPRRPLDVLDLGCGTGRFTPALADAFGGPVYGVEPSDRMRAVAEETARHERVRYLAGAAGRIPLPDRSCDLVLLFLVLHHVPDRAAAAAEIARVLRPGGTLLIRNTFGDRMPDLVWHRYFPRARALEEELFPALPDVVRTFTAAGLREVAVERVRYEFAASLAEHAERLRLRAVCTFEYLSEEETEAGFAAMAEAVAAEHTPQPVYGDCDLLVMSRDAPP